jgi:hypothetical protein
MGGYNPADTSSKGRKSTRRFGWEGQGQAVQAFLVSPLIDHSGFLVNEQ